MKLGYVSGPYRSDYEYGVVLNIRNAEAVAADLWAMGYAVICPHKNSALMGGVIPNDGWLEGDLEILSRCDIMAVVPGDWKSSAGTVAEVEFARRHGIPVAHWPDDKDAINAILEAPE